MQQRSEGIVAAAQTAAVLQHLAQQGLADPPQVDQINRPSGCPGQFGDQCHLRRRAKNRRPSNREIEVAARPLATAGHRAERDRDIDLGMAVEYGGDRLDLRHRFHAGIVLRAASMAPIICSVATLAFASVGIAFRADEADASATPAGAVRSLLAALQPDGFFVQIGVADEAIANTAGAAWTLRRDRLRSGCVAQKGAAAARDAPR